MEDQSRLLDLVPKGSSRATRKAKRVLVKGVKEAFSRLAVGVAKNNSLALAVASVKAELGADGHLLMTEIRSNKRFPPGRPPGQKLFLLRFLPSTYCRPIA